MMKKQNIERFVLKNTPFVMRTSISENIRDVKDLVEIEVSKSCQKSPSVSYEYHDGGLKGELIDRIFDKFFITGININSDGSINYEIVSIIYEYDSEGNIKDQPNFEISLAAWG